MPFSIVVLILLGALLCFAAAAVGVGSRVNLTAAGLFLVTLAQLLSGGP